MAEFTNNEILKSASVDWLTVFKVLVEFNITTKKIIVMDELQYIGKSNSAFPSIMQKIWEPLLKDANIMLILCGSLVSLMRSQTLDYSSPLYGRRTGQIKKGFITNYAAFIYEDDCCEKMWELSVLNTWGFQFDKVGRYWGSITSEIDHVAIDTTGKILC